MNRTIIIESVQPTVDGGLYPVKRLVGDTLVVSADIFRHGPDCLAAQVRWRDLDGEKSPWSTFPMLPVDPGNDRWQAEIPLRINGQGSFRIDAWTDVFATWLRGLAAKVKAGQAVGIEVMEGVQWLRAAAAAAPSGLSAQLSRAAESLRSAQDTPQDALALAQNPDLHTWMAVTHPRVDEASSPVFRVTVDRPRAVYGTWYEMFPRSAGTVPKKPATLKEAQHRLPDIAAMGFDVLYLPPIHPIGTAFRKGPNNSLSAGPHDVGSPWAIGHSTGGHTAIEPSLGTIKDFKAFVRAAAAAGLEIALDYALQCSPDHPWVKEHPEWFHHRPDGTIKYAENPPKKYQDVYPINFDTPDHKNLWKALLHIISFWVEHGVKIFRVDNPHTKPLVFWQWLIAETQKKHPEVIFLAEAFTRPKIMQALAKLGFTQSYTYFTWRNQQQELREYLEYLTRPPVSDYFRPNFFVNTPDILPEILQHGGPPAFAMRLVLAATLSATYGIYSGFELCENAALPNSEEYRNSEKYEIRVRDWDAPGNIKALITRINRVRQAHPALQSTNNVQFFASNNEQILCYGKRTADDIIIIVVNLDPYHPHHASVTIPPAFVGAEAERSFQVTDLLDGTSYQWQTNNYVRLDPAHAAAHVMHVRLP